MPDDIDDLETDWDHEPTWKSVAQPEHPFELVNFARNTGLLSILPFALYVCCQRCVASEIMDGFGLSDETLISLSVQDQLACLAGYNAIYQYQALTTFSWAYTTIPPAKCASRRCSNIRVQYLKDNFAALPAVKGLEHFNKLAFDQAGLCSLCVDQAEEMQSKGRRTFWKLLPDMFGLPPWKELRKEREMYVLISLI